MVSFLCLLANLDPQWKIKRVNVSTSHTLKLAETMKSVIVGGSLGGLMAGLELRAGSVENNTGMESTFA
jgi:hypothetical protein